MNELAYEEAQNMTPESGAVYVRLCPTRLLTTNHVKWNNKSKGYILAAKSSNEFIGQLINELACKFEENRMKATFFLKIISAKFHIKFPSEISFSRLDVDIIKGTLQCWGDFLQKFAKKTPK